MKRALHILISLTIGILAPVAHADIMHWFWEVEVNGQPADTSRPVVVGAGDQVDIELWAEFDPYRDGFAGASFAITTGDLFFESGTVRYTIEEGYGLNPYLRNFGQNGFKADENGDGRSDRIDDIVGFQIHPDWGGVEFDRSNPILIYSIGWDITEAISETILVSHAPTLRGLFGAAVWLDQFTTVEYPMVSDTLVIIPSPHAPAVLLVGVLAILRVRNRTHSL